MRTTDLFDNYLFGTFTEQEKFDFETRLKTDLEFATAFEKHRILIESINEHEQRQNIKQVFSTIHKQEFGKDAKIVSINSGFVKKHGKTVAVAASVAVMAVIGTLTVLSTGGYLLKKQSNDITDLKRDVAELKYSQGAIIGGIHSAKNNLVKAYAPANIEGTGFALNNKGYFITSLHMVKNADSVFVTNSVLDRVSAKLIASDATLDIAIYKLDNITSLEKIPYPFSFNNNKSEIGDNVFTIGYPRKDMVYGEGSLSALTGYNNDANMYQVSIPVNPGNSGGPLLDEQGNVIGIIRGKLSNAEGTGFAIKSDLIKQTISAINDESIKSELTLNSKKSNLKGLKRSEQIKKMQAFVFNIMVYKK